MVDSVVLTQEEWWVQVIEPSCQRILGMSGSQFMELTEEERDALNEKDHCGYVHVDMLCAGYKEWYEERIANTSTQ